MPRPHTRQQRSGILSWVLGKGAQFHRCCWHTSTGEPKQRTTVEASRALWASPPVHCAAAALLALRNATSNWVAATSGLGGAAWQIGGNPCGAGLGGQPAWPGVTCNTAGQVTALNLTGLGLEGTLPEELAGLPALAALDLSGNKFRGTLPAAWLQEGALPQLAVARLGDNLLGGGSAKQECAAGCCRIGTGTWSPAGGGAGTQAACWVKLCSACWRHGLMLAARSHTAAWAAHTGANEHAPRLTAAHSLRHVTCRRPACKPAVPGNHQPQPGRQPVRRAAALGVEQCNAAGAGPGAQQPRGHAAAGLGRGAARAGSAEAGGQLAGRWGGREQRPWAPCLPCTLHALGFEVGRVGQGLPHSALSLVLCPAFACVAACRRQPRQLLKPPANLRPAPERRAATVPRHHQTGTRWRRPVPNPRMDHRRVRHAAHSGSATGQHPAVR